MPLVEVSWWDHLGKDEGGDAAVEIAQELVNATKPSETKESNV